MGLRQNAGGNMSVDKMSATICHNRGRSREAVQTHKISNTLWTVINVEIRTFMLLYKNVIGYKNPKCSISA